MAGWLRRLGHEGEGSGGSAAIHIHRAPDTMTNLQRRQRKGDPIKTSALDRKRR